MKSAISKSAERGAVLVEFVLVLPLLLLLLMGTIEFGLLFYNQQVLTNASREGARAGIAHLSEAEIQDIVTSYCQDRLIRFDTDVNPITSAPDAGGAYGQDLAVTVNYNYTFLVPDLLGFGPNLELNASTVMKMEMPFGP